MAVIVAMTDDSVSEGIGDLGWQLRWWERLFDSRGNDHCPGSSSDLAGVPQMNLTEKELEELALDQEEQRREMNVAAAIREAEEKYQE